MKCKVGNYPCACTTPLAAAHAVYVFFTEPARTASGSCPCTRNCKLRKDACRKTLRRKTSNEAVFAFRIGHDQCPTVSARCSNGAAARLQPDSLLHLFVPMAHRSTARATARDGSHRPPVHRMQGLVAHATRAGRVQATIAHEAFGRGDRSRYVAKPAPHLPRDASRSGSSRTSSSTLSAAADGATPA
jgi:hypothetical protein